MSAHSLKEGLKIKKKLIKEVAIDILAEKGYFNTTTRMISERANIAVGSIYTHFKSKEVILDEIFEEEYNKRAQYLKSLDSTTMTSNIEKFNLFLDFHFNELSKNQNLTTVLIRESTNPELQHLQGLQNFLNQLPDFFRDILQDAIENKEIRELDPSLTAQIIFSTIRGTVFSIALKKDNYNVEGIKQELKDFINYAIRKI